MYKKVSSMFMKLDTESVFWYNSYFSNVNNTSTDCTHSSIIVTLRGWDCTSAISLPFLFILVFVNVFNDLPY